jgi:hypothetical protein
MHRYLEMIPGMLLIHYIRIILSRCSIYIIIVAGFPAHIYSLLLLNESRIGLNASVWISILAYFFLACYCFANYQLKYFRLFYYYLCIYWLPYQNKLLCINNYAIKEPASCRGCRSPTLFLKVSTMAIVTLLVLANISQARWSSNPLTSFASLPINVWVLPDPDGRSDQSRRLLPS